MMRRIAAVFRPAEPADREAGFTVVEVMVAMMVFAIMSIGIAYGIVNALTLSQNSRSRTTAVALASQDIDGLRQTASATAAGIQQVTSLPANPGDTVPTKTIGGVTYTISRDVNWVDSTGATNACGSASGGYLAYKSVVETVSWKSRNQTYSTTMTSAIAPSSAVTSPGSGSITISVKTAAGTGNAGVAITITPVAGGAGDPLTVQPDATNAQGCAIAVDVQQGDYTVTATETGGIDTDQKQPAKKTPVTVIAGASAYVPFVYDQASTMTLQYASTYSATLPQSMPTTLSSTGGGQDVITPWGTTPTITSATKTAVSVFPFGNYAVFAGAYNSAPGATSCLSPNPGAWSTPNAQNQVGVAPAQVGTSPGQPASVSPVQVMTGVVQVGGMSSSTYVVATTATTAGAGDPGCTAGYTLRFPTSSSGSQTLALPYGTWNVSFYSSITGTVLNVLNGASVKNVTPGTSSGGVLGGYTVVVDPRGQTK